MTEPSLPKTFETRTPEPLTVMFDGSCPLCRREVGVYRGLRPLLPLRWLDVSAETTPFEDADEKSRLMARFHVRCADGKLLSGAQAFVALWLQLPGWRWLGRMAGLPGATTGLEFLYVHFLRFRPTLQRLAMALESTKQK
jgi:ubiquinone biosynthesis monooxygenase Coq7